MTKSKLISSSVRSALAVAVSTTFATMSCVASAADLETRRLFTIQPQSLSAALLKFSEQADIQIMTATHDLVERTSPGATGEKTAREALELLLQGTGLKYRAISEDAVAIEPANAARMKPIGSTWEERNVRVAQAGLAGQSATTSTSDESSEGATESQSIQLEEITVTGSHIRGVENFSSPIIRFDRAEIERGGYATTQQLIQSLPQSLNSISDTTLGGLNGGAEFNASYDGAGINLRGLGGDATLVLLNGRRMAAAGNGSFVDISLIPLSAIERLDVLTDGASAIYGSDAVGGVANLVLRKDFDGAETRVRYGSVTKGKHSDLHLGQMFGNAWDSGQALVSYEYFQRDELSSADRKNLFASNIYFSGYPLIPEQRRHGALAVFNQRLTNRIEFASDVFFGQRDGVTGYFFEGQPIDYISDVTQYGGSVGLNLDFARTWQVRLSGLLDVNESRQRVQPRGDTPLQFFGNESRLWSMDLAADGALMSAPGGDVRLALGGQVRHEEFVEKAVDYPAKLDRDIAAVYAEVLVPWVSAQNRRTGLERLELTLAGRYENYSDFGSTFNPKIGLAWAPMHGFNVRGTWGTSFKAPLLQQMNPNARFAHIEEGRFLDPSGSGQITALELAGSGEALVAEESRNWTAGFDFNPDSFQGLSVSMTYFHIDFDKRISSPFPIGFDSSGVLLDPTYDVVVTKNPDQEYIQSIIASTPNGICFSHVTLSICDRFQLADQVVAVVDGRQRNLAAVRMSGIDFVLNYRLTSAIGDWGLGLVGSQLLNNRQRIVTGAPETSEMNKVWRPTDFRLRSSLSFDRNGFNVVAAINYTDDYRDTRGETWIGDSAQRSHVASWTTVDVTLQYDLSRWTRSFMGEMSVMLNATNVFDRDPPYIASIYGLLYDGVNANPLGRFLSAQLRARW